MPQVFTNTPSPAAGALTKKLNPPVLGYGGALGNFGGPISSSPSTFGGLTPDAMARAKAMNLGAGINFNIPKAPVPQAQPQAVTAPTPAPAPAPAAPTPTTYNTPATTGTPSLNPTSPAPAAPQNSGLYPQIVNKLSNIGSDPLAKQVADKNDYITGQVKKYAQDEAGLYNQGLDIGYGPGAAQNLQNVFTSRINAAETGLQNSLTAQGQQVTALGTAGNLAAPQLSQYGQTYYNPVTGQTTGGSGTAGTTQVIGQNDPIYPALQQYAQARATGQETLIPSSFSGNPALNAQITSMAQQINPSYNSNTVSSVVNASGANYGQASTQYNNINQQLNNIGGLGDLTVSVGNQGGINPFKLQGLNKPISWFRTQLSQPDQLKFNSSIVALAGAMSQLLADSSGNIPTQTTNDIQGLLSGSIPMSSLAAMLQQAESEGKIKLGSAQSQAQSNLQTQQNPGSATGNLGGTGGGSWPGWNP